MILLGCEGHIGGEVDAGPADASPFLCGPGPRGPHWVLEGDPLVIAIACDTDLDLDGDDFVFESLPPGASYHADTSALEWTPGLDQAALYGLLKKVRDLGLPLLSVNRVEPGPAEVKQ